jgi:ankyrin repeat protein
VNWLKIILFVFISYSTWAKDIDKSNEIMNAIYAEDYSAFASAYKQIENKESLYFTKGHFRGMELGYLALTMYISDPRFFNLVIDHTDPNEANYFGLTPLFLAPDQCAVNKARKLIAKGANVNYAIESSGATPLHLVVGTDCYGLTRLLLQHGANKRAKTKKGKTAYDFARRSGNKRMMALLKF